MGPELSRRVAQIMYYVRTRLGNKEIDLFIDRLVQVDTFNELSLTDQQLIIQLEEYKVANIT